METTDISPSSGENETWLCIGLFGAGVQVKGTSEDAQETMNKLAAHVQLLFEDAGITFVRKQQIIRRLSSLKNNGGSGDINDEIDAAILEAEQG